jgi:WD40 repeat protein
LHNQQYGTQIANFSQKGSQGIKQIKFSPFKKNMLGSAGVDGSVYIWDISSRQAAATFNVAHSSRVNALAFSTFNPVLLCSASLDMKINFYDINDKK